MMVLVRRTTRRRASRYHLSLLSFLLFDPKNVAAFVNNRPPLTRGILACSRRFHTVRFTARHERGESSVPESPDIPIPHSNQRSRKCSVSRRSVLVAPAASCVVSINKSQAGAFTTDCLSDLPSLSPDSVRLYLCRHGETDLNKRHLVQARADPPLNEAGVLQARLLGEALRRAKVRPGEFLHSPLRRARATAEIAATAFPSPPPPPACCVVPSLVEVDFGRSSEGRPVQPLRPAMVASYAAWTLGDVDVRMGQDGENGREVLRRVEESVATLVERAAQSRQRCAAAVSHSAFLRMMLATMLSVPLYEAALSLSFANASINVVDFPMSAAVENNRPFLVSAGKVLRLNEQRHLEAAKSSAGWKD